MRLKNKIFVSICFCALSNNGWAQEPVSEPANAVRSAIVNNVIASSDEDYQVAASDVIKIAVDDAPELGGLFKINKAGKISMIYLGNIHVSGKTVEEISQMIALGLEGRYLKGPKVSVKVEQYNSRSFYIQGAVKQPGIYTFEGKPNLFQLVTAAGGFRDSYGSTAYIIREAKVNPEKLEKQKAGIADSSISNSAIIEPKLTDTKLNHKTSTPVTQVVEQRESTTIIGDTDYDVITTSIRGFVNGLFGGNVQIHPNDLVYIPPADVFFVSGEVKRPGQFPLREGTTLRQAITLAEGTYFKSASSRAIIFRQNQVTGETMEIPVDIDSLFKGEKADLLIYPNDLVVVPNSKVKSLTGGLLNALGTLIFRLPPLR